jgi:hypothetical protein
LADIADQSPKDVPGPDPDYFFFLATFFLATFFLATFFFAAILDHLLGSDLDGGVPNFTLGHCWPPPWARPGGPAELPRTPLGLARYRMHVPFHMVHESNTKMPMSLQHNKIDRQAKTVNMTSNLGSQRGKRL